MASCTKALDFCDITLRMCRRDLKGSKHGCLVRDSFISRSREYPDLQRTRVCCAGVTGTDQVLLNVQFPV